MSLKRQIILVGALIFALALVGVAIGQWLSGRDFVREQMAAHTQETATVLALSLSTALREGDVALIRTTALPIFDRGYYRRIAVSDVDGGLLDVNEAPPADSEVPGWFAALARLDAPRAEALVSAGWRQAGRVEVEGDASFALRQLWHATLRALCWLLLVYVLAVALMLAGLRRLLAPMAVVERIAGAAAGRRIEQIALRTRVRELASFIAGFNRLAGLFNSRLAEEETRAEHFRVAALSDPLCALPNRSGLDSLLADVPAPAWLGLIEAGGVDAINREAGYAAGDDFVVAVADCVCRAFPAAIVARLHAATFAVALEPGDAITEQRLRNASMQLLAAIADLAASHGLASSGAIGWTAAGDGTPLAATLAAADLALASAQSEGSRICVRHAPAGEFANTSPQLGARAMVRWVERSVAAGSYSISWQTIHSLPAPAGALQSEVFLRLRSPDGRMLSAQRFFPLLRRDGDTVFLDRAMFRRLRQAVDAGELPAGPLAANLSAATFAGGDIPGWMASALEHWPERHPLVVELREGDVTAAPEAAERFADALRAAGVAIAIDHFGTHCGGIAAMRRLLPHYVKLDASLSRELAAPERRFQVEALVRSARSLEIPVWAQVFDAPGALELLAEMGIVGAQGYTLSPEQTLDDADDQRTGQA